MSLFLITALIIYTLLRGWRHNGHSRVDALLGAIAGTSTAILLIPQILSLASWLTSLGIWVAWLLLIAALTLLLHRQQWHGLCLLRTDAEFLLKALLSHPWSSALCVFFFVGTFFSSILYPVRNWDSLWHIMPRVFMWIQNAQVGFFTTATPQQISTYPFAALAITQVKLMWFGSDISVNLVQWSAYVLSIVFVLLLARLLGASLLGQINSALTALFIPMVILQATTTQYDLVVAGITLVTVYTIMKIMYRIRTKNTDHLWYFAIILGLLCGVGMNAKITFLLMVFPFLLTMMPIAMRKCGWRETLGYITCVISLTFVLMLPWFGHLGMVYEGDFLGIQIPGNAHLLAPDHSPRMLMTNAIRSSIMPLGTPIPRLNILLRNGSMRGFNLIGIDLDTPVNKEISEMPFELSSGITNYDSAASPITTVMTMVSAIVVILTAIRWRDGILASYVLCVIVGLLCITALITWQVWIVRTLIGSMLLACPLIGIASTHGTKWIRQILPVLLVLAGLHAVLVLLWNGHAPLVSQGFRPYATTQGNGWWNTSREDLFMAPDWVERNEIEQALTCLLADDPSPHIILSGEGLIGYPTYQFIARHPQVIWTVDSQWESFSAKNLNGSDIDAIITITYELQSEAILSLFNPTLDVWVSVFRP